ncbi:DUF882 domain-containing protein [Imbroritus primus]|uniref:DUF882 domain-containing protein n=1 Tax=Imbroritus primus TaxID=3058603 RepID=UPI003D160DB5
MTTKPDLHRRHVLRRVAQVAVAGATLPLVTPAMALGAAPARHLAFDHTHTREKIALDYAVDGSYVPAALRSLDHFMRDHYTGTVGQIDPALFDLLHALRLQLRQTTAFEVISCYRCPETNAHLKRTRGGGVATRSLHMDGKAIDIRIPGVALVDLRDAALGLQLGGVGYYPREQFVHVDVGRVRHW